MNTQSLRRPRVIVLLVAAVALLLAGGTAAWAASDNVRGTDRDRVAAAAVKAAGGGTAVDVEHSDDLGEAYEVEVRKADGTEVDITLDDQLAVVTRDTDRDDDDFRSDSDDVRSDDIRSGADDRALSASERANVAKAAIAAVGSGTAYDIEASDDRGVAYDAEVVDAQGVQWDVELDADLGVVSKVQDN